ncbi:armadillo repeat-containing protein 2 [Megalops cyprinoides]|uniref:armadillo repeat-containing protein 2 n=1 Tax=Megalops cyprinoides TaxID=118141 RepID=UPI001863DC36|nr:armadillo repeat-containing protein 2 [Megalops cyprinoides]
MSSVEKNCEKCKPFYLRPSPRKTSAEIISEARRSLRTICTQRPFTPRDDQRQLFGKASSRSSEGRPPSTFSLHARNFEESDSRPGSGKHLSPLEHKPRLPAPPDDDLDSSAAFPKPPADPLQIRRAGGTRARLFKSGSLAGLPPVKRPEESIKRQSSDPSSAGTSSPALSRNRNPLLTDSASTKKSQMGDLSKAVCEKTVPRRPASERYSSGTVCAGGVGTLVTVAVGAQAKTELVRGEVKDELEESVYWDTQVLPLLQELESVPQDSVERLCSTCEQLHCILGEGDLLGRKGKRRATLLRTLFQLIDVGSDQLNLQLAKVILALSVSGNNLLNICKLIFKISRSENNDALFQNNSIIDALLSVLHSEDVLSVGEAVLYCMGTLKFLSGNRSLLRMLVGKGSVTTLLQLSERLGRGAAPGDAHFPIAGHILVQLTATLRNLADLPESRPAFLSNRGLPELCVVLQQHSGDKDICTNIARIFSKLTSYNVCCTALANIPECYGLFLELLRKHQKKQDLVVRLVFTLGNLTAKNNEARERLWAEEGCLDTLLGLFLLYHQMDTAAPAPRNPGGTVEGQQPDHRPPSGVEDVLIKLIRVLANLSIHPTVGPTLASNTQCVELLLKVLERKAIDNCEELVINAAAAINNLSFYQEESSAVRAGALSIADLMLKLLLSRNMDGMLEAMRVFGNLSQSKVVRDFIVQNKVHQFVVTLLDSKNQDVCFSACGVLINLTADKGRRPVLQEEGVIQKLLDCLRDFGPGDWQLAGLVCQTLWNCSEEGVALCFSEQETHTALQLLALYTDEELVQQWNISEDIREFHRACWELEFIPVAQRLKNRIQSQVNLLEPLTTPS